MTDPDRKEDDRTKLIASARQHLADQWDGAIVEHKGGGIDLLEFFDHTIAPAMLESDRAQAPLPEDVERALQTLLAVAYGGVSYPGSQIAHEAGGVLSSALRAQAERIAEEVKRVHWLEAELAVARSAETSMTKAADALARRVGEYEAVLTKIRRGLLATSDYQENPIYHWVDEVLSSSGTPTPNDIVRAFNEWSPTTEKKGQSVAGGAQGYVLVQNDAALSLQNKSKG